MSHHILVAYATRAGATREIAEFIGHTLTERGHSVDVQNVKQVKSLAPYDAVLLGSNIRAGNLMPEVLRFARQHPAELDRLTKGYFVVCGTLREDTPENRVTVDHYLDPLVQISAPQSKGLFAGRFDPATMDFPWKFFFKNKGPMPFGDFRDWGMIRTWAVDFLSLLDKKAIPV